MEQLEAARLALERAQASADRAQASVDRAQAAASAAQLEVERALVEQTAARCQRASARVLVIEALDALQADFIRANALVSEAAQFSSAAERKRRCLPSGGGMAAEAGAGAVAPAPATARATSADEMARFDGAIGSAEAAAKRWQAERGPAAECMPGMLGALAAVTAAAADAVAPARSAQAYETRNACCCPLLLTLDSEHYFKHIMLSLSLPQLVRLRAVSRALRRWADYTLAAAEQHWVSVANGGAARALCMKTMTWNKCAVPPGLEGSSSSSLIFAPVSSGHQAVFPRGVLCKFLGEPQQPSGMAEEVRKLAVWEPPAGRAAAAEPAAKAEVSASASDSDSAAAYGGQWIEAPDLSTSVPGQQFESVCLNDGRLFWICLATGEAKLLSANRREWTDLPRQKPRRGASIGVLQSGEVVFVGGQRDCGLHNLEEGHAYSLGEVERWDPTDGNTTTLSPLPTPRHGSQCVTLPCGDLVVVGGQTREKRSGRCGGKRWDEVSFPAAVAYCPKTQRWRPLASNKCPWQANGKVHDDPNCLTRERDAEGRRRVGTTTIYSGRCVVDGDALFAFGVHRGQHAVSICADGRWSKLPIKTPSRGSVTGSVITLLDRR